MTNFDELADASLVKNTLEIEVAETIAHLTNNPEPVVENIIHVGLIDVGVKPDAPLPVFIEFLADKCRKGRGSFGDMLLDDLAAGQSFINLGGWVGDQREAIILMAIGAHHKAWEIITPASLGIDNDSEEGKQMMGMGLIYTSGLTPEIRTLVEAEQRWVDEQNGAR